MGARGDRIIFGAGKLKRSQPSADPEGGTGGLDPPGNSQVIWVSIGNKRLDLPHPPWKKFDPPPPGKIWTPSGTLKMIFFFEINHLTSVK